MVEIRHQCEMGDQLHGYNWQFLDLHSPRPAGRQLIEDGSINLEIDTVRHLGSEEQHGTQSLIFVFLVSILLFFLFNFIN